MKRRGGRIWIQKEGGVMLMREKFKSYLAKGVVLCMLSSLSFVACAKHPSKEQLQALEEAKQAAASAEAELAKKRSERDNLQRQLDQKKAELKKAQDEKVAVAKRLESMGN
jgi:septal ring factor EnvC (AmiA/AmiB activator)